MTEKLNEAIETLAALVLYFAEATVKAADAEIEYRRKAEALALTEDYVRGQLVAAGLQGKNELERTTALKTALNFDTRVQDARMALDAAHADREHAKAHAAAWDARQKAARATVAALTALVAAE